MSRLADLRRAIAARRRRTVELTGQESAQRRAYEWRKRRTAQLLAAYARLSSAPENAAQTLSRYKASRALTRKARETTVALHRKVDASRAKLTLWRREYRALRRPVRTSRRGLELIASFEGWVDHVYRDPVGIPTIGFGHVVRSGESFPATISRDRGLALLAKDAATAEGYVRRLVTVRLTQAQFDALVCFIYNVGGGAFGSSTLLSELNAGRYGAAADQFLRWTKAGGATLPGLVRRREAERSLFLS